MQISIDMWEISFIQLRQWFDSETSLLCAYSREIKCMFTKKINKYKKKKRKKKNCMGKFIAVLIVAKN